MEGRLPVFPEKPRPKETHVAGPGIHRIVRPYSTVEEYLAREASTIGPKDVLLVDQAPEPVGTAVRFEIVLSTGEKVLRGEGVVTEHVAPTPLRPGGVRVRFRRFDAKTKEVIDRAVALRNTQSGEHAAQAPVPTPRRAEHSGVRHRPGAPVAAPSNREELLQKLRERTRGSRPARRGERLASG